MSDDDYLSPEMQEVAFAAWIGTDTWSCPEYIGIAQGVLLHVASRLKGFAVERFNVYGPHDARGAALWDAAAFVDEKLIGDPLRRRFADPTAAPPVPSPEVPMPPRMSTNPGRIEHMNRPRWRGTDGLTFWQRRRHARAFMRGAGAMPSKSSFGAARDALRATDFKSP